MYSAGASAFVLLYELYPVAFMTHRTQDVLCLQYWCIFITFYYF